jgi:hypothetical protein
MRLKLCGKSERFIEFVLGGRMVFDLNRFMVVFCSLVVDPATAGLKEEGKAERWPFAPNSGSRCSN